jgi:leucyl-tRNA synthetase
MKKYNPKEIEPKWQARWEADNLYQCDPDQTKPKWYFLTMFPYPSGALHAGHWFMYAPPDAKARYLRMQGYNVFFPMGFDAFGLPAENAAIKNGLEPKNWTYRNMEQMRQSFRSMGASCTGSNTIITCGPEYYRWTQWLFIQFFKHDLAYRKKAPVDWCPTCNTSLAREQVKGDDRHCERCETAVIKRDLDQWLFRTTRYAEELLDFSGIDWPEQIQGAQTEWIGRSEGAHITFDVVGGEDQITVFTTRPDTLFGATALVLAPEHPLVATLTTAEQQAAVKTYIEQTQRLAEKDRLATTREKTGVALGAAVAHPFTGAAIPIWIADYVLMNYGTGAIMSVPAHDERDFAFATKYQLPIPTVIAPPEADSAAATDSPTTAYCGNGIMVNSGQFDGLDNETGKQEIVAALAAKGRGKQTINYRLHDWLISRQRYWGAPIPMIHCPQCGTLPVPEDQLPVMLPEGVEFRPTGESPLKLSTAFRRTTCPQCQGQAERDTDTMDTFVDSSWYWYRYTSPRNQEAFYDREAGRYWLPVDEYAGGKEHATMHLLYARFVAKALNDMGYVEHREPFKRLFNQGLIMGADGNKMSKSRGNVIDPNEQVDIYGADCFRTFLMFIGPWEAGGPWSSQGIEGVVRFYRKVWSLVVDPLPTTSAETNPAQLRELQRLMHKTINKVGKDIEQFQFNTAVSCLMEFVNFLGKVKETTLTQTAVWPEALRTLVLLLAPLAPHIAEELWAELGETYSVHQQRWPAYDASLAADEVFTLVVQINGKVRERLEDVPLDITSDAVKALVLANKVIAAQVADKPLKNFIYVPKRLVNIVV